MKKIVLLLGLLLVGNIAAQAACEYECVVPYNMNNKFRTIMSAATGFNSLTEMKVESLLKKEVLKTTSSDNLKIDLQSYSPRDLKNGIFKSMHASGTDVEMNGVHLASLDLKTLCDFNYIQQTGEELTFVEALPMAFDITLTQDSLNKTMEGDRYQKIINDFNRIGAAYGGGLQIASTKVAIKNNKFYYIVGFNIPFFSQEQKMVLETDLKAKNGKIDFANTKLVSGKVRLDLKRINFLINYLNPLDFSVHILKNKDAKVYVNSVDIKNNTIVTDGIAIIPKD